MSKALTELEKYLTGMNDWIKTTRLKMGYHLNKGISLEQLYENFAEENQNAVEPLGKWTRKLFDEALFPFDVTESMNMNTMHIGPKVEVNHKEGIKLNTITWSKTIL